MMARLARFGRRLRRDGRGVTVVEFAFVAPLMTMTLLALTDFGYRSYLRAVIEGTLTKAARKATVGGMTSADIDAYVNSQLSVFSKNATITITKSNYYDFSGVGKPEKFTDGTTSTSGWIAGKCYYDLNNDGLYTTALGRDGLGGSDDIVYYKVDVTAPRIVPLTGFLGWSANQTVSAMTIMRNQPYGAQVVPRARGGATEGANC